MGFTFCTCPGVGDADLMGCWGDIIDAIKLVMPIRRDAASENFLKLLQLGSSGEKDSVDGAILDLVNCHYVDHLFMGILEDTLKVYLSTIKT